MCFSCSKDSTTLDDLQATSRNKPDDQGMHDHGGTTEPPSGGAVAYQLTYVGFLNGTAHAIETVNNKKREAMDISACDQSYDMMGIDLLATFGDALSCTADPYGSLCISNNGINLNKGKQNPGRVRVQVQFNDPADCHINASIWMFGYIYPNGDPKMLKESNPTLYPTGEGTVTIIFDEWYLDACDGCATGTDGNRKKFTEGSVDQILMITKTTGCKFMPCQ